jgi:predicted ATPase
MFDRPFSIESVSTVATDAGISGPAVIETLASLVSKSLVCAQSFAGKTRYHLLNTTRAYVVQHGSGKEG